MGRIDPDGDGNDMKYWMALMTLLSIIVYSCATRAYRPTSTPVTLDGESMLVGEVSFQDILHFYPDWNSVYQHSEVPDSIVQQIRAIRRPITLLVFLGTWCGDSRDGVPPFLKIIQHAHNPNLRVILYGVDRQKLDPDGLAVQYHIERVPTFIVLENGVEIGRMIEFPEKTFAEDFLEILASSSNE